MGQTRLSKSGFKLVPVHIARVQQVLEVVVQPLLLGPAGLLGLDAGLLLARFLFFLQLFSLGFQLGDRIPAQQVFQRRRFIRGGRRGLSGPLSFFFPITFHLVFFKASPVDSSKTALAVNPV